MNGLKHIFKFSRHRSNIISCLNTSTTIPNGVKKLHRRFLTERIREIWNKLPSFVHDSDSIISFKCNLENFKSACLREGLCSGAYYWNVSNEVLSRIETPAYLISRSKQVEFLRANPFLAKKRYFNLRY